VSDIAPLAAHSSSAECASTSGIATSHPAGSSNRRAYADAVSSDVLTGSDFAAKLADPEWCEAPLTDSVSPCTIADARTGAQVVIPVTTPRLFVGIASDEQTYPAFDIVLRDSADLAGIEHACATNPQAVIVLAQLLRTTETTAIGSAVVAESFAYSMLLAGPEFARWRNDQPPSKPRPVQGDPILVTHTDERVTITLNRPEVRNAYNAAMRDALIDVLRAILLLEERPMVELRGAGPAFGSGGDLGEFGTTSDVVFAHQIRTTRSPGLLLDALGTQCRARVHGACVGAGIELPAFCRRVEATADATFQLPEVTMGLIPGAGGTASIPRRIGRQQTAYLAVSGKTIDARTAHRIGLVDSVHE
jgi:hypothetical protein